jgi:Icc-related predicted phosphoesterase
MKLHILSDLHVEFGELELPETNADVVILAGDIHVGKKGFDWAKDNFRNQKVIYVLGNHEYYRKAIPKLTEKLKERSVGTNVHILENEALTIENVLFLGCTLWSDFRLLNNLNVAVIVAQEMMNDYKLIRLNPIYRKIQPSDTAIWHRKSRSWLEKELKKGKKEEKKTVVITHHAPSILSVPEQYKNEQLSASFASEMETFIEKTEPDLWIHGHIHTSSDYHIGSTRVICNPRGYANEPNHNFDVNLVVEI